MSTSHPFNCNITEFAPRHIAGDVRIANIAALRALLDHARAEGHSIYPISSGMNWGQGSRLPVRDGAIVADLSPMNRIISLDIEHGRAILEPGVTQAQLAAALAETPYFLPMTGSSASTSVVGNLLERGATFFGHRNALLLGVEAMLGDGRLVRTGHWHFDTHGEGASALHYARGLGPDLTHIFTQSNLGIVTRVALRLLPRPAHICLVTAYFPEAALTQVVDTLHRLLDARVTREGTLVTNANDPRTSARGETTYRGHWFAATAVTAMTRPLLDAYLDAVRTAMSAIDVSITASPIDEASADVHPYLPVLADLARGIPSDYSLRTMCEMAGAAFDGPKTLDLDRRLPGFSVALPAVPWRGDRVSDVIRCVNAVSASLGLQPFHNFASIAPDTFEGFYRIYFDRNDPDAIAKAHQWNERVHLALEAAGFLPYRLNVARMAHFVDRPDDTFWQLVRDLKSVTDPDGMIAPGRYCP